MLDEERFSEPNVTSTVGKMALTIIELFMQELVPPVNLEE